MFSFRSESNLIIVSLKYLRDYSNYNILIWMLIAAEKTFFLTNNKPKT